MRSMDLEKRELGIGIGAQILRVQFEAIWGRGGKLRNGKYALFSPTCAGSVYFVIGLFDN